MVEAGISRSPTVRFRVQRIRRSDSNVPMFIELYAEPVRLEQFMGAMTGVSRANFDAFDFTGADFAGWCTEAGFKRCETLPLTGPASAAIAYK
jgi:hypothetical protein